MKGRGLVLHEPTRSWAADSLPTAGHRDRAGGPRQGTCRHQVPKRITSRQVLLWNLTPGSQGTCSGLASGRVGGEPSLGAVVPLMASARHTDTHGHTHTDKWHMQTWTHLCLRAQLGLRPRVVVRHLGHRLPAQGPTVSRATANKDSSAPGSHPCPCSADPTSEPRVTEADLC